ncbi:PAP2-domain-containing protein [Trametes versicolor FP-101664 SS1]|uniref:PAP2-domain-containing protein n=1 Tax=Trametes versicolor (strain FP-101664) TaxID=717944 RepID=UPI0004624797|nr:PAP2-domain-containing protein [Trametes versicolor FP-101664 SS1]EIW58559.1 PAP2-domain-containing protein [Trametes versicolor FP-101664 SS1]
MSLEEPVVVSSAALDLTYVLYNDSSVLSHILALLTLTPILLNPAYAALAVWTRELLFFEMWAGQMLCECFNYVLKHIIQEERPNQNLGDGYGFPSSHSQWMGYFASFLILHFTLRHRWTPTGFRTLDLARDVFLYAFILAWAGAVAFSRYYLSYHSIPQVLWGFGIGVAFGTTYYMLVEHIPTRRPNSLLGEFRTALLANPVSTWFRIRDGWLVWPDSGTEAQWLRWREEWNRQRLDAKRRDAKAQ